MNTPTNKGFTLIEMITVLAIFTIMTSIVIFNHNKFTSETILTNMAYEVALSVREAQIYGVSVRNPAGVSGSDFNKEFGIHFPYVAGGSADYYLFADAGTPGDNKFTGTGCAVGTGECVTPYTLQRGVKIVDVQLKPSNGAVCEGASDNDLSVLFKRIGHRWVPWFSSAICVWRCHCWRHQN